MPAFRNKLVWAIIVTLLTSGAYARLYRATHHRLSRESIIGVAMETFGLVLNFLLVFRIANLNRADLGALESEQTALILAMLFTILFSAASLFESFAALFSGGTLGWHAR